MFLIPHCQEGSIKIMKVTAWRDMADLFAVAVNEFPNSKFRLSNLSITPAQKEFRGSSNMEWEATLKRPLSVKMLERGAPARYVSLVFVTLFIV